MKSGIQIEDVFNYVILPLELYFTSVYFQEGILSKVHQKLSLPTLKLTSLFAGSSLGTEVDI